MFLFKWCCSVSTSSGYQIIKKNKNTQTITFVNQLKSIPDKDQDDPNVQILQLQKSQYEELAKEFKSKNRKFQDTDFPPNQTSLGQIPNLENSQWKRLSDLLNKPALFDGKIQPKDVVQGSLGECYFLSSLAALAEKEEVIRRVFGKQAHNESGIYKVTLRINGVIKQIVVDESIPVNSKGQPLFCQPNKNQFWVLILQKAWAKIHGSYANIVAGSPRDVFKAVTYAPAQIHSVKQSQDQQDRLWLIILDYLNKGYPCCCNTDQRENFDWERIGLNPGHTYTILKAAELVNINDKTQQMLILRNAWGIVDWQGEGSEGDDVFWDQISPSQQKKLFESYKNKMNDGIFFIKYNDFCKFFSQIFFSLMENNGNYVNEKLFTGKKNGSIYSFTIKQKGTYIFELHQQEIKKQQLDLQNNENSLCRSTLLVCKIKENNNYEFINGVLKYNDADTTLKTQLQSGNYLLYAKLDPSRVKGCFPNQTSVSVYSSNFTSLTLCQQKNYPDFLTKMFLSHAVQNKRQTYNNGLMWIAWKLLFQEGGYAYIAFGNSSQNNKKFVVTVDEANFDNFKFKLKKGFKNKGTQTIQVLPGQEKIILARVKNVVIDSLRFPPQVGIKIEEVGIESKKQNAS